MRLITAMLAATVLVAATVFSRERGELACVGGPGGRRAKPWHRGATLHPAARPCAAGAPRRGLLCKGGRVPPTRCSCCALSRVSCPQPCPSLPWQRRSQCERQPRGLAVPPLRPTPPRLRRSAARRAAAQPVASAGASGWGGARPCSDVECAALGERAAPAGSTAGRAEGVCLAPPTRAAFGEALSSACTRTRVVACGTPRLPA